MCAGRLRQPRRDSRAAARRASPPPAGLLGLPRRPATRPPTCRATGEALRCRRLGLCLQTRLGEDATVCARRLQVATEDARRSCIPEDIADRRSTPASPFRRTDQRNRNGNQRMTHPPLHRPRGPRRSPAESWVAALALEHAPATYAPRRPTLPRKLRTAGWPSIRQPRHAFELRDPHCSPPRRTAAPPPRRDGQLDAERRRPVAPVLFYLGVTVLFGS